MKHARYLGVFLSVGAILSSQVLAGGVTGTITVKGARDARDAIVFIDAIPDTVSAPPEQHALMDQRNMVFVPHVLPVVAGTTVDFSNDDDVLHNVFTPAKCAEKFNLGTWPKGQKRSYTFTEVGCVSVLLCNVHPEMEAYVVVLPTPYFAVTDKAGKYAIEGVPPGTYTLKVWHEKLTKVVPETQQVTVSAEGVAQADFLLRK